jgi:nicotinamide riboside transporter PnuC
MWIVTVFSIVGVILNIKKRKECFIIWSATNAAWACYDFYIGAYAQSALFTVYFILALWGLHEWKTEKQQKEQYGTV